MDLGLGPVKGRSGSALPLTTTLLGYHAPMPWRLHRYMLVELLRIIGLTTAVLVVVTAFGAVIKPLAGGVPLGPGQVMFYVALGTVPMLQYALPFAAGFGTTLVLHRMASDNEILAMSGAGLSYRTIFAPIIVLACVLAIGLIVLANTVIPRVNASMGRILAGDVVSLLEHSVRSGKPMSLGDMQIWAEGMHVEPFGDFEGSRIQLNRVAAAQMDAGGVIRGDVSARGAVLELQERDGVLEVRMVMEDAVSWDSHGGGLRGFPRIEPTRPILLPMPERTQTAAMTWWELLEIDRNPLRYPEISQTLQRIREAVQEALQHQAVKQHLQRSGGITLVSGDQTGQSWRIQASSIDKGAFKGGSQPLRIERLRDGQVISVFTPASARLRMQASGAMDTSSLRSGVLDMEDVQIQSVGPGIPANHRAGVSVANLLLPPQLAVPEAPDEGLLDEARAMSKNDVPIRRLLSTLEGQTARLHGQVESRLWRRGALGITAFLLPLLGALLALLLRSAQPLVVYMVGFLPGLLDLVLISGGAGTLRNGDYATGLIVLWSGSLMLIVGIVYAWLRVRRN